VLQVIVSLWCSFGTDLCRYRSGKCCVIDWKSQGMLFWKTCRNPVYVKTVSGKVVRHSLA